MNGAGSKASGTYRAALAAVIILSVLVVAAIVGVVAGFMRQYRLYQQNHAAAPAASSSSAAAVQLSPGAHIVSATTDAGKLVLHVATPSGGEVDIFDLATGRLTAQVKDAP
jgi:hypothetical protein